MSFSSLRYAFYVLKFFHGFSTRFWVTGPSTDIVCSTALVVCPRVLRLLPSLSSRLIDLHDSSSCVFLIFSTIIIFIISLYGHHRVCWNNPFFSNLVLWAAHWAHSMFHHESWPTLMSHPFFSIALSALLEEYITRKLLSIFVELFLDFAIPGYLFHIIYYSYILSFISEGWSVITRCQFGPPGIVNACLCPSVRHQVCPQDNSPPVQSRITLTFKVIFKFKVKI